MAASATNLPFLCPRCLLSQQATELSMLKKNVDELSNKVANLKMLASSIKTSSSQASLAVFSASHDSLDPLTDKQLQTLSNNHYTQSAGKHLRDQPFNSHSKKFNLVFFGIAESQLGTRYHSRLKNDHTAISSVLASLDESLCSVLARDFIQQESGSSKTSPSEIQQHERCHYHP